MIKSKVCIVVPLHKEELTEYEKISLQTIQKHFIHEKKFLITYSENKFDIPNFEKKIFNRDYFKSVDTYNNLCVSIDFYKNFQDYKYILICQLDVIVIKNEILKYIDDKISYIGAPTGKKNPFFRKNKRLWARRYFCNGGFSLRNVNDFINTLESNRIRFPLNLLVVYECMKSGFFKFFILYFKTLFYKKKFKGEFFAKNFYLKEDTFWTYFSTLFNDDFRLPTLKQSTSFSFDGDPYFYYKKNKKNLPMALHGHFNYLDFLKKIKHDL